MAEIFQSLPEPARKICMDEYNKFMHAGTDNAEKCTGELRKKFRDLCRKIGNFDAQHQRFVDLD